LSSHARCALFLRLFSSRLANPMAAQQCMHHMTLCVRSLSPPPPSARKVPTRVAHVLIVGHFQHAKNRPSHPKSTCSLLGWSCLGPIDEPSFASKGTSFIEYFRVAKSTSQFATSSSVYTLLTCQLDQHVQVPPGPPPAPPPVQGTVGINITWMPMTTNKHDAVLDAAAAATATEGGMERAALRRARLGAVDPSTCGPRGCPSLQAGGDVAEEADRLMAAMPHYVIPRQSLGPALPPAEAQRDKLQRMLATGWGPWLHSNMLPLVKLPDAATVMPELCRKSTGVCVTSAVPDGARPHPNNKPGTETRVGHHAFDRSYVHSFVLFIINPSAAMACLPKQPYLPGICGRRVKCEHVDAQCLVTHSLMLTRSSLDLSTRVICANLTRVTMAARVNHSVSLGLGNASPWPQSIVFGASLSWPGSAICDHVPHRTAPCLAPFHPTHQLCSVLLCRWGYPGDASQRVGRVHGFGSRERRPGFALHAARQLRWCCW
jgi:hypothetical protein